MNSIISNIILMMEDFLNQSDKNINWYEYSNLININSSPYIQKFKNELYKLSESTLRDIYKNFRKTPPTTIFTDISEQFVKYYKNIYNRKIKMLATNMELDVIVEFLSYALVIEVVVHEYINRINKHFGWLVKE